MDNKREVKSNIKCSACDSGMVYILKNKTTVCRRCGLREEIKNVN